MYDTHGNGAYADVDRMMREHRERGFNCLRLDSGAGFMHLGAYLLNWEEKCEEYWQLLEEAALMYRDMGLWGSVVRTCCGPEDPVWYSHPDRLKKVNELFLSGDSDER